MDTAKIPFRVVRSARKTIAIQILPTGEVLVRAPKRLGVKEIQAFVDSKARWVEAHLPKEPVEALTEKELRELAAQARAYFPQRVAHFAPLVGVTYGRITIRSQRTRWGSCSGKGNLNFNCLLMNAPAEVRDYVVVHELCHRKHMNHSAAFWAELAGILPEYREKRKWLRENGNALIARLANPD